MTNIDKCLVILAATHDGDDLTGHHLYLVQVACNGGLSAAGETAFAQLHDQVASGTYTRPWFRGIEHLTQDTEGYIYWKGHQVEHYSFHDADAELAAAHELAARCLWLESQDTPITSQTAVWQWPETRTEHRTAA